MMANTVSHGGYYQSTTGSPPKTPNSTSKFPYARSGPTNTPPFIPGYFTPPDSRENSPALGGTSPNPQGKSDLVLQQFASTISATASESRAVSGHNAEKTLSEPWTPTESPSIIQEESFECPKPMPEKTKIPTSPIVQMGGFPPTHGTFGRAESRRYQRNNPVTAPPSQLSRSIRSPTHRYKKSDASTIAPLPSTVYVPGVGDTVGSATSPDFGGERYNYYGHCRDRSVSDPISRFSPWSDTPPLSVGSPSISSPFLPLEPDTPVTATSPAPQLQYRSSVVSSQAELIGLWKATQKSGIGSESPTESGGTHVLNMYRQAPPPKSRILSKHPFASPENFTFGPNPQTPFYTMHALRENPEDDAFNELSFLRRDPVSGLDTSVITLGLESPFRHTLPTRDGLIALLYPKEAVLSAMLPLSPITDGADDAPRKLRDHEQRTREAIQNAYATECCRLSWNAARKRYYLYHPGVAEGGDAYLVEIEGEVGFDCEGANGTIKLINVDTNETFTELDFNTGVLYVNTCATLKIPSDHMVDVAVATVLTVATVEGRRRRVVRMNQPQPSSSSSQSLSRGVRKEHKEKKRRGGCLSGLLRSLCF